MYYQVEKKYVDTNRVGIKTTSQFFHDKAGNHLDLGIFYVRPLYDFKHKETYEDSIKRYAFDVKRLVLSKGKLVEDKTKNSQRQKAYSSFNYPKVWLGIHYSTNFNTRIPEEEQLLKRFKFYDESEKDFESKDIENFVYLKTISDNYIYSNCLAAAKDTKLYDDEEPPLVLEPEFKSFDHRSGPSLECACVSFVLFAFLAFLPLAFQPLYEDKLAAFYEDKVKKRGIV